MDVELFLADCSAEAESLGALWLAAARGVAERSAASERTAKCDLGLLAWARKYLPRHFAGPPSRMHLWLDEVLSALPTGRGARGNVIGPRGGAKSTIGSFALPLWLAVSGREKYVWIVSDTKAQAVAHLDNVRQELVDNVRLAADYPRACGQGPVWRANRLTLRNGAVIEAFGAGQRLRGRRVREFRPTLIVCDDLQNDSHVVSPAARERSREWFHGTIDNRVNKLVRIRRLGPYLSAGRMKFKLRSAGTQLLVSQLKDFPIGDHDDGPDALEMAMRLAIEISAPLPSVGLGERLI